MEQNLTFADLGLSEEILQALEKKGYGYPTRIQAEAIPEFMQWKDVIAKAPTGTGKTFAFGIPMIEHIDAESEDLQGLILAPTRELAIQICDELRGLLTYYKNIRVAVVYGGAKIEGQIKQLKNHPQIVVATPGRLMDHYKRHTLSFDKVQTVVLDEADRMLDMGFFDDVTKIIEKYAVVNDRNYLSFRVNDTRIIDTLGDNAAQIARIESLMEELIEQREFHVDSIVLTASASPEGSYAQNERLARGRAAALKQRLGRRFGRQVDTLLCVRWVAEDWEELTRLIAADGTIAEREAILGLLRTIGNPDRREAELRRRFPKQYRDIRERLYPLLRAVNFKYDLRRVGMVKDTIHTTVPDTLYARGVKLLNEREYNEALRILRPYEDRNTAVAMLSLGHDEQAYEVLCRLEEEATVEYLKAVACARMGRVEEGKAAFRRACELQPNFEYRGNLDPEIRELITTQ